MRQVEFHGMRVRQGFQVEEAQEFARYVRNSNMCELMRQNPCQGENQRHTQRLLELFPYDGDKLYEAARQLELECCEYWSKRTRDADGTATGARKSDLEDISHKLDLIAGRLAAVESMRIPVKKTRLKVVKLRQTA